MGVFSHTTNNTSGPGGGGGASNNESSYDNEQPNIVATLGLHTNAAMPVASLALPIGKSQLTTINSPTKQSFTRRVRSRSKTDGESVSDKSLFSRLFSKKSKKPMGTLITTTTKSIDLNINKKGPNLINKLSLTTNEPRSTADEEEYDYEDDNVLEESNMSINSMSGANNLTQHSNKNSLQNSLALPASDSQYYASLSSAPTGFSISYHKRLTKGNDNLRIQAAIGRLQQQQPNQKGTPNNGGTSQLMVCHTLFSKAFFFFSVLSVHRVFYALREFIVFIYIYSWHISNNALESIRKEKRCSEMRKKKCCLLTCLFHLLLFRLLRFYLL